MSKKQWCIIAVILIVTTSAIGARHQHRESVLNDLARAELRREDEPFVDSKDKDLWSKRNRRFAEIWLARKARNVTEEILPYLDDPFYPTRVAAVRAIGRLEDPHAEPSLKAKLDLLSKDKDKIVTHGDRARMIPATTLQFAIGRIQSRDLKGRAKVEALAKSMGLTWAEVGELSYKCNGRFKGAHAAAGSPAIEIVREFVDVLYRMGKKGENIEPLANSLTLSPAQQVQIKAAKLSTEEEITLILDYAVSLKGVGGDSEHLIEEHLMDLGPRANEMLRKKLEDIKEHPERYPDDEYGTGRVTLLRAAGLSNDQRMLPLVKYFASSSNKWTRYDARRARDQIEHLSAIPSFP
jgi:hypothetical protein